MGNEVQANSPVFTFYTVLEKGAILLNQEKDVLNPCVLDHCIPIDKIDKVKK